MLSINRDRNIRSSIFDIVRKFEIGRKFAELSLSASFFLGNGVTDAILELAGNARSPNDSDANRMSSGANTSTFND
jgi:hypothetical protein